ncbi:VOC family protein [Gordonia malaquae]|uniref:VOC family protein n=1 Tax=Gordonia malaquae TaxID=410332 RepID=UPI0030FE357D
MLTLDSDRPCLLLTGDMSRLAEFWRRALRLSVGRERNDRVELVDDDRRAQIIVRQVMPPRPRVRVRLSAFDTQDVAAAVERLIAFGASSPMSPYPAVPGRALVIDPDGNTVEITADVCTPARRRNRSQ